MDAAPKSIVKPRQKTAKVKIRKLDLAFHKRSESSRLKPPQKTNSFRHKIFLWHEGLSLGVPEIDRQHKRWFLLTNSFLNEARKEKMEIKTVQEYLAEVVRYAQTHFKAEEAFMRRVRVPADFYRWHTMSHNAFVQRINMQANRCRNCAPTAAEEMAAFMTGWLTRHILKYDVRYVKFYRDRNIS
jgi:hemerythrin-like metal-binding protein